MRFLLLSILSLSLFAADDSAKVLPTTVDRVQAFADPVTGNIERVEIYDANSVTDSVGGVYKTPLRVTVVLRADAPALFAALDALINKTSERDNAHRARKAAELAADEAAKVKKP